MRYFFAEDDDSHWYMIPVEKRTMWKELKRSIYESDTYSDEWYGNIDKFSDAFSIHRVGGGIEHIEFENPDFN